MNALQIEGTSQIMEMAALGIWGILFLMVVYQFIRAIRLVPTMKAYVVERLGRYHKTLGPGIHPLIPFIEQVAFIQDLKEESIAVPPQVCFTRDNVQVEVDGVIYISIMDPVNASYGVTDYRYASIQLAQTTTRSVIGTLELDRTFEERDMISSKIVNELTDTGVNWGIKVHRYEIKNIVPPQSVKDAMEKQVTAERERRAIIAKSEGEKQSRINRSEGHKAELINRSEGEKQRRVNEAQGHAAEIGQIATATADSIEKIAEALVVPGGEEALNLQLSKKYMDNLFNLASSDTHVLLPADMNNIDDMLATLGLRKTQE